MPRLPRHLRPLAFPFERFDGAGRYSETDRFGNELRADGVLVSPVVDEDKAFAGAREFGAHLADHPRVKNCLSEKAIQFAVGRTLEEEDACLVDTVARQAFALGGTFSDLITAVVMHPTFRAVRAE